MDPNPDYSELSSRTSQGNRQNFLQRALFQGVQSASVRRPEHQLLGCESGKSGKACTRERYTGFLILVLSPAARAQVEVSCVAREHTAFPKPTAQTENQSFLKGKPELLKGGLETEAAQPAEDSRTPSSSFLPSSSPIQSLQPPSPQPPPCPKQRERYSRLPLLKNHRSRGERWRAWVLILGSLRLWSTGTTPDSIYNALLTVTVSRSHPLSPCKLEMVKIPFHGTGQL